MAKRNEQATGKQVRTWKEERNSEWCWCWAIVENGEAAQQSTQYYRNEADARTAGTNVMNTGLSW